MVCWWVQGESCVGNGRRDLAQPARCLTTSLSSSPIGLSLPAPPAPDTPPRPASCFFSGLLKSDSVSLCLVLSYGTRFVQLLLQPRTEHTTAPRWAHSDAKHAAYHLSSAAHICETKTSWRGVEGEEGKYSRCLRLGSLASWLGRCFPQLRRALSRCHGRQLRQW